MSEQHIQRLRNLAVATLSDGCDQIAGKRGFMDHEIKPRVNGRKIAGVAATASSSRHQKRASRPDGDQASSSSARSRQFAIASPLDQLSEKCRGFGYTLQVKIW